MTPVPFTTFIAIVGGSGSGKSWLGERLARDLGPGALSFSLDEFYRDQSRGPSEEPDFFNYDLPSAIEWSLFKKAMRDCEKQNSFRLPQYDFTHHRRSEREKHCDPPSIAIVDGLWLLHRPDIRRMFDLTMFLDCPEDLRMHRRIERDVAERGRTLQASWHGFHETVNAMHRVYVAPQKSYVDHIVDCPFGEAQVASLRKSILTARLSDSYEPSPPLHVTRS
ncbi:MAG: hypothetical protein JJT75_02345 [Opitutales bacterium]|nr:hypothetical protein [Opitutales bacterium]MCH8539780.1 hypothetical protein [Opitutales bacterium]